MRQANSTIRGYLYQFNKSIFEILSADDDASITLEGIIEDIDIDSANSSTTIQCKYHEDKKYQISNVAEPILEMLCHYQKSVTLNKDISYILYAYYKENEDSVDKDAFVEHITTTNNKDILLGYYHQIYTIPDADSNILKTALKSRKTEDDKKQLLEYYKTHRSSLKLCVNIDAFWKKFKYQKAEQYDALCQKTIDKLSEVTDKQTAEALYYPNAFSRISYLSSKADVTERRITRKELLTFLAEQKSVLVTRWTLAALDKAKLLRNKKASLSAYFRLNSEIRAFIFSKKFAEENSSTIMPFVHEYIEKYYKKRQLQKPPIFIFDNCESIMNDVILGLYTYQKHVNNGMIARTFMADSFINNTGCTNQISCKMTLLDNTSTDLLEKCNVNQLFIVGNIDVSCISNNYFLEKLDIEDIKTLRYLVGLATTLED